MFHRWAALVSVLALCAMSPKNAAGQSSAPQPRGTSGRLGRNFPNPFNPQTFIPFAIGDTNSLGQPDCGNDHHTYVVSLPIRNILSTLVATPVLQGPSSTVTT